MKIFVLKADDDPDPILRDGQRMRTGGVVLMDAAHKVLTADAAKTAAAIRPPPKPLSNASAIQVSAKCAVVRVEP